ncbi:MAG: 2OG-Fe(II) oxygenase [Planctomycetota bacterium]|nr:2OG-Fe(II) oxygenase [Planctomycetota bacterium]
MNREPTDFIGVYDDALPAKFCQEIIEMFEAFPQIQTAGRIGSGVDTRKKESMDACISEYQEWTPINQRLFDTTLEKLVEYVLEHPFLVCGSLAPTIQLESGEVLELTPDNIKQVPREQLKNVLLSLYRPGYLNLQKYTRGTGGYHHWHSECYPREENCETLHRVLLFMFFLNTVDEGGQTDFYYQQQSVAPQAGRMVIAPAGFTHTHKGNVPISSDKYIVTSWILFQRAEQLYGQPAQTSA